LSFLGTFFGVQRLMGMCEDMRAYEPKSMEVTYTMRSLVIYTLNQILLGWSNQETWDGCDM
jgi:hypothetical protein